MSSTLRQQWETRTQQNTGTKDGRKSKPELQQQGETKAQRDAGAKSGWNLKVAESQDTPNPEGGPKSNKEVILELQDELKTVKKESNYYEKKCHEAEKSIERLNNEKHRLEKDTGEKLRQAKTEIEELSTKLLHEKQTRTEAEKNLQLFKTRLNESEKAKNSLQGELTRTKEETVRLTKDLKQEREMRIEAEKKLQGQLRSYETKLNEWEKAKTSLKGKLSRANAENVTLTRELQREKKNREEAETSVCLLQSEKKKIQGQLQLYEKAKNNLEEELNQTNEEKVKLNEKLERKQEELKNTAEELEKKRKENKDLDHQLQKKIIEDQKKSKKRVCMMCINQQVLQQLTNALHSIYIAHHTPRDLEIREKRLGSTLCIGEADFENANLIILVAVPEPRNMIISDSEPSQLGSVYREAIKLKKEVFMVYTDTKYSDSLKDTEAYHPSLQKLLENQPAVSELAKHERFISVKIKDKDNVQKLNKAQYHIFQSWITKSCG